MIFPKNIIGPKFDDGDLVSFTFDDAELTLRIPVIPINRDNVSEISPIKDFRDIKTSNWNTDDQNHPSNLLSLQHWCVEDEKTLDDIAFCRLFVELVEATESHQEKNSFLQSEQFKKIMLEWQTFTFKRYEEKKYLQDSNWPTSANQFYCRTEPKQH